MGSRLAAALRRIAGCLLPGWGYGRCAACRRPWWAAEPYLVVYRPGRKFFVCCRPCWVASSVLTRVAYARALHERMEDSASRALWVDMHWGVMEDARRLINRRSSGARG